MSKHFQCFSLLPILKVVVEHPVASLIISVACLLALASAWRGQLNVTVKSRCLEFGVSQIWIPLLSVLLTSCVVQGKLCHLSELCSLTWEMRRHRAWQV